jgi:hypothetical protein
MANKIERASDSGAKQNTPMPKEQAMGKTERGVVTSKVQHPSLARTHAHIKSAVEGSMGGGMDSDKDCY